MGLGGNTIDVGSSDLRSDFILPKMGGGTIATIGLAFGGPITLPHSLCDGFRFSYFIMFNLDYESDLMCGYEGLI